MNDHAVILRNDQSLTCSVSDQAKAEVERVLALAALVPAEIESETDQNTAVHAQREIRLLLKTIETSRKAVKEPVLKYAKLIDDTAKEWSRELSEEDQRIGKAAVEYQLEQQEKVREAARKRAEEEARLEAEKRAELERIKAEAERQMAAAKTERDRSEIAVAAQGAMQQVVELAAQNAQAVLPPVVVPPKAEGQMLREVWLFDVVDIHLLYRNNPGLVRLEANRQEIQECFKRGITSIPGLRVWKEMRSGARVAKREEAIDV